MKKIIGLLAAAVVLATTVGCGDSSTKPTGTGSAKTGGSTVMTSTSSTTSPGK